MSREKQKISCRNVKVLKSVRSEEITQRMEMSTRSDVVFAETLKKIKKISDILNF